MMDPTLSEQVSQLVSENQHLRVKSDNDNITLALMKQQYDALSSSVESLRNKHDREAHTLRTERDVATIKFKTIDTLLLQASNIIMQALRARQGDDTPEQIPERPTREVRDDRLPIARFTKD